MTKRARKPETNGDGYRDRIVGFKRIPAGELIPNEKNWRTHPMAQQAALKGVLAEIGIANAVIARKVPEGYQLLDGHLRTDVAPNTKWPVLIVDLDDDEAEELLGTLDPLAAMAGANAEKLEALLANIQTGSDDVQALLANLAKEHKLDLYSEPLKDPPAEIDKAAELQKQWQTEPGQLWEITGESGHRLMCGDSTKAEDVERLMGGAEPFLMVTDPPYGVEYDTEWREETGNSSMGPQSAKGITWDESCNWAKAYALSGCDVVYVWHAGVLASSIATDLATAVYVIRCQIIWRKSVQVFSRGAYHWGHEPCWYAVKKGKTAKWCGDRTQSTIWDMASPRHIMGGSDEEKQPHPTQKPLDAMARPIANHGSKDDDVYDPFLGSGTTLIAAENLGRRCFGMEISPEYVAVSLERATKLGCKCTVG